MNLIEKYIKAKNEVLEHVGLIMDWVECPIDDCTNMFWDLLDNSVVYSEHENFDPDHTYEDEIYTQRFYPKHVYEGEEFTLIFCDPHVDMCRWWRIFDNKKRVIGPKK